MREQNKDIWFLAFNMIPCLLLICRYGNANVWKTFTDLFDFFPLTALVSVFSLCSFDFKLLRKQSHVMFKDKSHVMFKDKSHVKEMDTRVLSLEKRKY